MAANAKFCAEKTRGSAPGPNPIIPQPYACHPLVRRQLFFTIPQPLFKAVVNEIGTDQFDPELLKLETVLADLCGDHTGRVGFWGGRFIPYHLLRQKPLAITLEQATENGWQWNESQLELLLKTTNNRLDRFTEVARGYVGWLMLNPKFRVEHLELFQTWREEVSRYGIPQQELVVEKGTALPKGCKKAGGRTTDYARAFEEFFIRWRLASLASPFLPSPLQPQLPVANVLGHMRLAGSVSYLPDTFPIPSREELRDILEDGADRQHAPEHLQDWQTLVCSSNTSKKAIARYARLFELHHFWRVLYQRHAKALHRRTGKLEEVFASFLRTSPDSIHKDLGLLTGNLGDQWVSRN